MAKRDGPPDHGPVRDGVVQGYDRVLLGTKIIEWCNPHPEALEIMICLHECCVPNGITRKPDIAAAVRQTT